MSAAWDWGVGAVEDAGEWVGDVFSPEQARVPNAPMQSGDSKTSMMQGARNTAHYAPGEQMSPAMQQQVASAQARGQRGQDVLTNYGVMASGYGDQARQQGQYGSSIGAAGRSNATMAGQRLEDAGTGGANIGGQYGKAIAGQGQQSFGQIAPGQGMAAQGGQNMFANAGRLSNLENEQGPSAAQAQLRSGLNQAQSQNLAMARSGGGFGGDASRSRAAMRQNAAMGQEAANQSAVLKAGEDAAWRQRQAQNLSAGGNLYGAGGQLGLQSGQLGLGANAQAMQGLQAGGEMSLAGNAQRMQGIGQGGQLGLAGTQAGLAGNAQAMQGYGQAMQGAGMGGQLAAQGYGLGFAGDQASMQAYGMDMAAKQAYEQMLTQQQGIQAGVAINNAATANQFTGSMIGGAAAAGMGLMSMSDVRQKELGEPVKMSSELYGNPYGRSGAPGHYSFDDAGYADTLKRVQERQKAEEDQDRKEKIANAMEAGEKFGSGSYSIRSMPQVEQQQFDPYGQRYVMSDERNKRAPSLRDVPSYEYEYKDTSLPGTAPGKQVGPIAQDIERAIPGATIDTPNGKMVDPGRTVLPLLSAVGEQQERIDRLEAMLGKGDSRLADNSTLSRETARWNLEDDSAMRGWVDQRQLHDAMQATPDRDDETWPPASETKMQQTGQAWEKKKPLSQQTKEAARTFVRSAIPAAADSAALPVTGGARLSRWASSLESPQERAAASVLTAPLVAPAALASFLSGANMDELAGLSGHEALADAESLRLGTSPAQIRRDLSAERAEYPNAATAGKETGLLVGSLPAGAALGRAAQVGGRAAGRVLPESLATALPQGGRAALMTGAEQALKEAYEEPASTMETAYLAGRDATDRELITDAVKAGAEGGSLAAAARGGKIVRPIVEGSELAGDPRLGSVQDFLNKERRASSLMQREGYPATIREYGGQRASRVARVTRDTQEALQRTGKPTDVTRGASVAPEELAALEPGETYSNKHIWSVATNPERAEGFARHEEGKIPVRFEVKARTGVKADSVPGSNTFEEGLLPAGGNFRVLSKKKRTVNGRDGYVVQLEEI